MMLVFWKCNKSATIRQSRLFGGCRTGWGLMVALLLAACSTIDDSRDGCADIVKSNSGSAIAFSASSMGTTVNDGQPVTRAIGMIMNGGDIDYDPAEGHIDLHDAGFGVFASYTGMHKYSAVTVKPDFMYNDHVYWDAGITINNKWNYSPLRYWPNGEGDVSGITGNVPHYVSFFAYAPYSDGDDSDPATNAAGYCIPSFSNAHEEGDPWLVYRLIDQEHLNMQVDLLYADGSGDLLLDRTKLPYSTDDAGRVNISFKHALACFGEKMTITLDQKADPNDDSEEPKAKEVLQNFNNAELRITRVAIVYQLTPKARLVLWNQGEPNWQPIVSQVMLEERTVTLLDATRDVDPDDPITLFDCTDGVANTSGTYYDDTEEKFIWDSSKANGTTYAGDASLAGRAGLFFIPVEVDGFPQTATVSVTYEVLVQGVKDESMSTTKTSTIALSKYYDSFQKGGQRMNQINITLTLDDN